MSANPPETREDNRPWPPKKPKQRHNPSMQKLLQQLLGIFTLVLGKSGISDNSNQHRSKTPRQGSGPSTHEYPNTIRTQAAQLQDQLTQILHVESEPWTSNADNHEPHREVEHQPKHFVTASKCTECGNRRFKDRSSLPPTLSSLPEQVICEKCPTPTQDAPDERTKKNDNPWRKANFHGKRKRPRRTKRRDHGSDASHTAQTENNPQEPIRVTDNKEDERPNETANATVNDKEQQQDKAARRKRRDRRRRRARSIDSVPPVTHAFASGYKKLQEMGSEANIPGFVDKVIEAVVKAVSYIGSCPNSLDAIRIPKDVLEGRSPITIDALRPEEDSVASKGSGTNNCAFAAMVSHVVDKNGRRLPLEEQKRKTPLMRQATGKFMRTNPHTLTTTATLFDLEIPFTQIIDNWRNVAVRLGLNTIEVYNRAESVMKDLMTGLTELITLAHLLDQDILVMVIQLKKASESEMAEEGVYSIPNKELQHLVVSIRLVYIHRKSKPRRNGQKKQRHPIILANCHQHYIPVIIDGFTPKIPEKRLEMAIERATRPTSFINTQQHNDLLGATMHIPLSQQDNKIHLAFPPNPALPQHLQNPDFAGVLYAKEEQGFLLEAASSPYNSHNPFNIDKHKHQLQLSMAHEDPYLSHTTLLSAVENQRTSGWSLLTPASVSRSNRSLAIANLFRSPDPSNGTPASNILDATSLSTPSGSIANAPMLSASLSPTQSLSLPSQLSQLTTPTTATPSAGRISPSLVQHPHPCAQLTQVEASTLQNSSLYSPARVPQTQRTTIGTPIPDHEEPDLLIVPSQPSESLELEKNNNTAVAEGHASSTREAANNTAGDDVPPATATTKPKNSNTAQGSTSQHEPRKRGTGNKNPDASITYSGILTGTLQRASSLTTSTRSSRKGVTATTTTK